MDNWQYLVNTVGDLRFRRNDPDVIARVLEALSYVFEEKGEKESGVLMDEARDLRANPTVVYRPPEEVEDEEEDDEEGEGDDPYMPPPRNRPSSEEGNFDDLVRNLRWFMKKLR